jgi:ATP-binding cassette subfamily C (CFTR/MRP) protein 1
LTAGCCCCCSLLLLLLLLLLGCYQPAAFPCTRLQVSEVRKKERRLLFWNAVIKTINVTMVFGVPPVVTFAVLVPYETSNAVGRTTPYITPVTAFTMLSLFNVMRFPLVVLPKALRCVSEAINAIASLEKFLAEPAAPKHDLKGKPGVQFHNAVFRHETSDSPFRLRVPEFSCQPGELVAVVGRVGAGKSSLLNAIMGNMTLVGGAQAGAGGWCCL